MFDSVLRVKYVHHKSCFLYLSTEHTQLNTGTCLRLSYNDNETAYFSANIVRNIVDSDCIGINSLYAKVLSIKENDLVNVSEIEQLPVVNSINIQPSNKTDYEVLELLASNVQSHLLDLVRIVNVGQKIVIWIGNNISIVVYVESVQPIYPGTLDFLTEVVIKPPDTNMKKKELYVNSDYMKNFVSFLNANSSLTSSHCPQELKLKNTNFELIYRLIPISELPVNLKHTQPFKVFIFKDSLHNDYITQFNDHFFFKLIMLQNTYNTKELYVELCFLDDIIENRSPLYLNNLSNNVYVHNSILKYFQCDNGVRVCLKSISNELAQPSEICVQHCPGKHSKDTLENLKLVLSESKGKAQILNADFPIRIGDDFYCSLTFPPSMPSCCVIDGNDLRNCTFSFNIENVRLFDDRKSDNIKQRFCEELEVVQQLADNVLSVLWRRGYFQSEHTIITGRNGMGKTQFLNYISVAFKEYPYFLYVETIECKAIKGKTVDSLHKIFMDCFSKLVLCQPSVLVLDDLHVLCERCEGEETPNTVYINRVSEMLCNLLWTYTETNKIAVLASVESLSKLNRYIYRSRGNHLFKNIFGLNDLTKTDRLLLLKYFFNQSDTNNLDYNELLMKTDGFVVQDIKDFYDKALFEAYKEGSSKKHPVIDQNCCERALKKTCSLALQNVKFHSPGSKTFDDIGGLSDVKTIMIESFLWPVKYSNIFSKAPLRLQSGLLLYGCPGTGKTLLAGAAAKQCNLRLISIKGPELLSKYIGASEQAVRDVFDKAQRAKPCVLFFDEFDSLAPRRGHDNTGVTDRVVNQFLTQLDGVESLTGVCVLAATSRPDLLDPALLRPGRLDKQILCQMPDTNDRLDILRILSRKLDFGDDVNLEEIAEKTEDFSGADLQSLLYSAQLASMKLTDDQDLDLSITQITQTLLLDALSKTRPSLTKSERRKYEQIYAKFQGGNLDDFKAGSKVTLA
ncbi:peroxisomal biogenesis factor 1 isoform X2 [Rhynchophorus ferrugineus]|uniref:peroxisomal biogenesis factor 1 isoform X2 n=1 Tax=Rhynchophorus ferrugineus TaxID=354439 RepID=UPI003FCE977C